MKKQKFHTLLALLLMAGGMTMQAQEQRQTNLFESQRAQETVPLKMPTLVSEHSEWIHYGTDVYGSNLAYIPQGIPFSWAVSFPAASLQSYAGHTLTQVALYENEWNFGNLKLGVYYGNDYMPLYLQDEQIVVPEGIVGLCEIRLDHPFEIDVTHDLWVVFSELDATETYSAAFCYMNASEADPHARWVQMEENKWADAASYGPWEEIQFMIWAYLTDDPWGVEEPIIATTSSVYPNPGGNTLNIRTALQNAHVEVYDVLGRLIHSQELAENVTSIDAENWTKGVYVWKVISNGNVTECGKWIKE